MDGQVSTEDAGPLLHPCQSETPLQALGADLFKVETLAVVPCRETGSLCVQLQIYRYLGRARMAPDVREGLLAYAKQRGLDFGR